MIDQDNVLDIPRQPAPHALGLEQRILAASLSKQAKRRPWLKRWAVIVSIAAAVLVMYDVPTKPTTLIADTQDDNFNTQLYELMELYDDQLFAQL